MPPLPTKGTLIPALQRDVDDLSSEGRWLLTGVSAVLKCNYVLAEV